MTEIERIMLSEKYTILFARRGQTIVREGFALNAKEAMNKFLYANERALVFSISCQLDDNLSVDSRDFNNV